MGFHVPVKYFKMEIEKGQRRFGGKYTPRDGPSFWNSARADSALHLPIYGEGFDGGERSVAETKGFPYAEKKKKKKKQKKKKKKKKKKRPNQNKKPKKTETKKKNKKQPHQKKNTKKKEKKRTHKTKKEKNTPPKKKTTTNPKQNTKNTPHKKTIKPPTQTRKRTPQLWCNLSRLGGTLREKRRGFFPSQGDHLTEDATYRDGCPGVGEKNPFFMSGRGKKVSRRGERKNDWLWRLKPAPRGRDLNRIPPATGKISTRVGRGGREGKKEKKKGVGPILRRAQVLHLSGANVNHSGKGLTNNKRRRRDKRPLRS